jgi:hypothetical protein
MSGFSEAHLWGSDYLFLFLDFNDFVSNRADSVRAQLDAFGARLGPKGWVVSIFERMSYNAADEVFEKPWPEEFKEQLAGTPDPAMLVIDQDFNVFDPREHRWAAIWFAEHEPASVYRLLNELANRVRRDEDLFSYLAGLGRKDRFRRFARYFEVKPGLFGVSLNAGAIFDDLAEAA